MKKFFLVAGLLIFVTICFAAGFHASGLVQHLLVIGPVILVLKVACGKEGIKKNDKVPIKQTKLFTVPTQLELEFEAKAMVNA